MKAMQVTDPVGPASGRYTRSLPAVKAIPRAAFGLDRATAFDMRVAPTRGDRIDSAERMPDTGIDILDAATIDRLTGSDPARAYVKAIVSAGAAFYVDNANVETKAITVGGKILPILIASGRQDGN